MVYLVLPFWYRLTRVVLDKIQKSYKTIVCVCAVWYRFNADDPVLMCQKNAAVAAAFNRSDLVQVKHVIIVQVHLCIKSA